MFLSLIFIFSCGDREEPEAVRISDVVGVAPYNRVTNLSSFRVVLTSEPLGFVNVNAWEADTRTLSIEVIEGELIIRNGNNFVSDAFVYVPCGGVVALSNRASGSIESNIPLSLSEVHSSGFGKISLPLDSAEVSVTLNSIGNVFLWGRVGLANISSLSDGVLEAPELVCDVVNIDLRGRGDVLVGVVNGIRGDIWGIGNLHIYGRPVEVLVRKNSLGDIFIH